jgi:hypothetical protein
MMHLAATVNQIITDPEIFCTHYSEFIRKRANYFAARDQKKEEKVTWDMEKS